MTLHEQYAQMMITGIIEIVFGVAVIALGGWFLWKRYGKKKPISDIKPEDDKDIQP